MTFSTLTLVGLIALLGPILALRTSWHLPVVLGQLLAGIVFGASGFDLLHTSEGTFTFLANVGFALVMFVAGSRVPVADTRIRGALLIGAVRAVAVGVLAVLAGVGISHLFGTGHALLYAVLIGSSSAALVLPIVDALHLAGSSVLQMLAQVAIADTVCIVALPLAIDPTHAARAALGTLAVGISASVLFLVLRSLDRSGLRRRLHRFSDRRKFALELRINLVLLFALAALAEQTHVSIMLAGFSFGLAVAGVGEPHRLTRQLFAVTDGFLGPLFFVWLGASIDLGDLADHPRFIGLGVTLGVAAMLAHGLMRAIGLPVTLSALAAAQLGVPVAAATLGTQLKLLDRGEAPALILGSLITIAAATAAGSWGARQKPPAITAPPEGGLTDGRTN